MGHAFQDGEVQAHANIRLCCQLVFCSPVPTQPTVPQWELSTCRLTQAPSQVVSPGEGGAEESGCIAIACGTCMGRSFRLEGRSTALAYRGWGTRRHQHCKWCLWGKQCRTRRSCPDLSGGLCRAPASQCQGTGLELLARQEFKRAGC